MRIAQIDRRYKVDAFSTVRLIKDKLKQKGLKSEPIAKYRAVRTGLSEIPKTQFFSHMFYTEAQINNKFTKL